MPRTERDVLSDLIISMAQKQTDFLKALTGWAGFDVTAGDLTAAYDAQREASETVMAAILARDGVPK